MNGVAQRKNIFFEQEQINKRTYRNTDKHTCRNVNYVVHTHINPRIRHQQREYPKQHTYFGTKKGNRRGQARDQQDVIGGKTVFRVVGNERHKMTFDKGPWIKIKQPGKQGCAVAKQRYRKTKENKLNLRSPRLQQKITTGNKKANDVQILGAKNKIPVHAGKVEPIRLGRKPIALLSRKLNTVHNV